MISPKISLQAERVSSIPILTIGMVYQRQTSGLSVQVLSIDGKEWPALHF